MRILVLADIHANSFALNAISEPFDACLFLGDLVEYGTDPVPCIDWVRQHATATVRGNHDHSLVQRVAAHGQSPLKRLTAVTRQMHYEVLRPSHLKFLSQAPLTQTLELDGHRFCLVHATPRDPMDEYLPDDPADWQARIGGIDAEFLCVGHTHRQMHLEVGGQHILNPGSVGQPRDGEPGAAYAIIENGRIRLGRVAYNIDQALAQCREAGLPEELVALNEHLWRTGGELPS